VLHALIDNFVILFVVVDPIGLVPLFASLTRGSDPLYRRRMALRGVALAALMLVTFFVIGDGLLRVLGVGLPAFRIAGGALLFLLAIDMVFARQSGLRSTTLKERAEAVVREDISVFPLAFPLISGPGALTSVLLMATAIDQPAIWLGMFGVMAAVLVITAVTLLASGPLLRLLGETGANAIDRLLGLILAALAVQFVLDGLVATFPAWTH